MTQLQDLIKEREGLQAKKAQFTGDLEAIEPKTLELQQAAAEALFTGQEAGELEREIERLGIRTKVLSLAIERTQRELNEIGLVVDECEYEKSIVEYIELEKQSEVHLQCMVDAVLILNEEQAQYKAIAVEMNRISGRHRHHGFADDPRTRLAMTPRIFRILESTVLKLMVQFRNMVPDKMEAWKPIQPTSISPKTGTFLGMDPQVFEEDQKEHDWSLIKFWLQTRRLFGR
jgi:hypothetical protein